MFRRLPNRLPQDCVIDADLDKLGYFVTEHDQIRQKIDPKQKYQYRLNRSERVNDIYKEAMNTCTRKIVVDRLADLGIEQLPLPLGVSKNDKHIPIFASKDLSTKTHVIVIFPERHIDAGILSYRITGDESINEGSVINFVKSVLGIPITTKGLSNVTDHAGDDSILPPKDIPGIVIANTSQLIWYRGGGRVVTEREWGNLPRESAVHNPMRIDEDKNKVSGNKDFIEHIRYVFEHVLFSEVNARGICHPHVKISIIGQEYPGSEAIQYVTHNWSGLHNRINCVALINPQHTLNGLFANFDPTATADLVQRREIEEFIARRTRAYRISQRPLECLLRGRDELGCNIYAAGETQYEESCFVRCWPSILDWIEMCRVSESYSEPYLDIQDSEDEDAQPKIRSPRRKLLTEQDQETVRFHGDIALTDEGTVAQMGS